MVICPNKIRYRPVEGTVPYLQDVYHSGISVNIATGFASKHHTVDPPSIEAISDSVNSVTVLFSIDNDFKSSISSLHSSFNNIVSGFKNCVYSDSFSTSAFISVKEMIFCYLSRYEINSNYK